MNLLDENIFADQRRLLHRWRIRVHHIGFDVGRAGMDDDQIISFRHQQPGTTFFTSDRDFWERGLCHARCEAVLHHPSSDTRARRMGKVVAVRPEGLLVWKLHAEERMDLAWP